MAKEETPGNYDLEHFKDKIQDETRILINDMLQLQKQQLTDAFTVKIKAMQDVIERQRQQLRHCED